jgi:prepilin-type N-terminal cleavage/methylation domain-containing protein
MKKSKGFTLIELMMVIFVLGIFYSIAAANVMGLQNEAKMSRVKGDLRTLQLAIESYAKKNIDCPRKDDYQVVLINSVPNILQGNLMDPFGRTYNTLYSYDVSSNMQYFVVYSVGSRRKGDASISNDGKVESNNDPIIITNGFI